MTALVGCPECDLLQRPARLESGGIALCARCGARLYKAGAPAQHRVLALALASLIVLPLASAFPLVGLDLKGSLIETTLFGAARALYDDDMRLLAALVFTTTIVLPAAVLAALVLAVAPLGLGTRARSLLLRAVHAGMPWCMLEVFMLAVLVALAKLGKMATVVPDTAAWALGALVVLWVAALTALEPFAIWKR
jgi:paraquat-inducible protein A